MKEGGISNTDANEVDLDEDFESVDELDDLEDDTWLYVSPNLSPSHKAVSTQEWLTQDEHLYDTAFFLKHLKDVLASSPLRRPENINDPHIPLPLRIEEFDALSDSRPSTPDCFSESVSDVFSSSTVSQETIADTSSQEAMSSASSQKACSEKPRIKGNDSKPPKSKKVPKKAPSKPQLKKEVASPRQVGNPKTISASLKPSLSDSSSPGFSLDFKSTKFPKRRSFEPQMKIPSHTRRSLPKMPTENPLTIAPKSKIPTSPNFKGKSEPSKMQQVKRTKTTSEHFFKSTQRREIPPKTSGRSNSNGALPTRSLPKQNEWSPKLTLKKEISSKENQPSSVAASSKTQKNSLSRVNSKQNVAVASSRTSLKTPTRNNPNSTKK